mgnify:CR=1 FL=1
MEPANTSQMKNKVKKKIHLKVNFFILQINFRKRSNLPALDVIFVKKNMLQK